MSLLFALLGLGIASALTIQNARAERVPKLPFVFSAVHVLYVFPKVLALVVSDTPAADYFRANGVTFTVAYMALLSYLATIIAYYALAPRSEIAYGIDNLASFRRRLSRFSIVVGFLGLLGFLGLMVRTGGVQNYFFNVAFYQLELSGVNVWLIFISRFIYPAIAAMALIAAVRPTRWTLSLLALFAVFPIMNVVFLFRRSDLLFLGFIGISALTISGRLRINRMVMVSAIGFGALLITLFPFLRQESISAVTGWDYGTYNMTIQERIAQSFEVNDDDEIVRAASIIDYTYNWGEYEYGTFIWDSLVNQFVPATLVGAQTKSALLIGRASEIDLSRGYFDVQSHFYVAPMGFAQAYQQLGPFGWVIFAALGALVARVERKSWKASNRIFLMVAIPIVCLAASNDLSSIPSRLVTFWILTRFLGQARFLVFSSGVKRDSGLLKILTRSK